MRPRYCGEGEGKGKGKGKGISIWYSEGIPRHSMVFPK